MVWGFEHYTVHIRIDSVSFGNKLNGCFWVSFRRPKCHEKSHNFEVVSRKLIQLNCAFQCPGNFKRGKNRIYRKKIASLKIQRKYNDITETIASWNINLSEAFTSSVINIDLNKSTRFGEIELCARLGISFMQQSRRPTRYSSTGESASISKALSETPSNSIVSHGPVSEEIKTQKFLSLVNGFPQNKITKILDFHEISVLAISLLKYNESCHDEIFQVVTDLITNYDDFDFDRKMMTLIIGIHLVTNLFIRKIIREIIITELTDVLFRIFCDLNDEFNSRFNCDCDIVDVLSFLNRFGSGKICRTLFIGVLLVFSNTTMQHPGLFFVSEARYLIYYGSEDIQSNVFRQIILDNLR